jgi:bacteriocin biosynthesis cyclodehydratase domain-containing protein
MTKSQKDQEAILSAVRCAGLELPTRPRLSPWLAAIELGDARLQLRSAESSHTLSHPTLIQIFRRIKPILDGRHTVDDIISSIDFDVLPTTVIFLLQLLHGSGLLQPGIGETTLDEREQAPWGRQLRFLSHFVPDASSLQSVLANARVGLAGSGDLQNAMLSAMASIGIGSITELADPQTWSEQSRGQLESLGLIVACAESPAFRFFDTINRACLASHTRWLRVCISGTSAQLGPTVVPHQTACYTCLDLRLRTHQPELDAYSAYQAQQETAPMDEGSLGPLWSILAGQAAMEVMRLLTGFAPPATIGRFHELSAVSPVAVSHNVLKVPRCASCGRRRTFTAVWDEDLMLVDK